MAETKPIFCASDAQVGDRIGSLLLIANYATEQSRMRRIWLCRCDTCGTEREVRSDHLVRYVNAECRCKHSRPKTLHGLSGTREYKIWTKMIARCHSPNANNYRFYGGRGVFVCDGWRRSASSFVADMGISPSNLHTLDRIDTQSGYTCGHCNECRENNRTLNCRWATKDVQARNAKNNRYYTHDGQTLILKDWARLLGIDYHCLYGRIERGWTFEEAIEQSHS